MIEWNVRSSPLIPHRKELRLAAVVLTLALLCVGCTFNNTQRSITAEEDPLGSAEVTQPDIEEPAQAEPETESILPDTLPEGSSAPAVHPAEPSEPQAEQPETTQVEQPDTQTALEELEALFNGENGSFYRKALCCSYGLPDGIDWNTLSVIGLPGIEVLRWEELSAAERSALERTPVAAPEASAPYGPTHWTRISGTALYETLERWFGTGAQNALEHCPMVYLPEFDCRYEDHQLYDYFYAGELPLELLSVDEEPNGCYLLHYRFTDSEDRTECLCRLTHGTEGWHIVGNYENPADAALSATPAKPTVSLSPACSDELECAVSGALLDTVRELAPKGSLRCTESHRIAAIRWTDTGMQVYALTLGLAWEKQTQGMEESLHEFFCTRLQFDAWPCSDRVFYELTGSEVYDLVNDPDGMFPGAAQEEAMRLLAQLGSENAAPVAPAALDVPADSDASAGFYAAMSGWSAEEAAQAVADCRGKLPAVLQYRLLGIQQNKRENERYLEELAAQLSDSAEAAGEDAPTVEDLRKYIRVVELTSFREYDSELTDAQSAVTKQSFCVIRDEDSGAWRVYREFEPVELIDYQGN